MDGLITHLHRFQRRQRLVDGWDSFQRGLWVAGLSSLFIQILGRLISIADLQIWTAIPPAIWFVSASIYHLFRLVPISRTARRVDIEMKLFERLSTSLAMQEFGGSFPEKLVAAQAQDALRTAHAIDLKSAYPLRILHRSWITSLIIAMGVITMALMPNPMDLILNQREAIVKEAEIQAQEIEKLRDEVEQAMELSPDERQEIIRQLAELAEKFKSNRGDLDQALADLSKVEREIQSRLDSNAPVQAANLQSLVDQLQSLAGQEPTPDQDLSSAVESALGALAEEQSDLDAAERQALSNALSQLAVQAAQSGSAPLSQALSKLAQAVQSNNQNALQNSSQQMTQTIAQAQQSLQAQSRLAEFLSALQASRQSLAQAGQSIAQASPSSGSQGQTVGGGGGTNAPVLPPASSQGLANPPQGSKPFGSEDDLNNQGMIPRETGNNIGDELYLPGIDTGQGEIQVRPGENPLPGIANPALVPYDQAYFNYLNAAMQALGQNYIPMNLMDYVQQYFLLLEPQ